MTIIQNTVSKNKKTESIKKLRDFYFFLLGRRVNIDVPKEENKNLRIYKKKETSLLEKYLGKYAGYRTNYGLPLASPLMMRMCRYRLECAQYWLRNSFYEKSTLIYKCPTLLYTGSVQALVYRLVRITREYILFRKPLPFRRFIRGIYNKLLSSNLSRIGLLKLLGKEPVGLKAIIMESTYRVVAPGYVIRNVSSHYKREYMVTFLMFCCQHLNLALCIGFSIWYANLPSVLLETSSYKELLFSPEILNVADRLINDWYEHIRNIFCGWYDHTYAAGREPMDTFSISSSAEQGLVRESQVGQSFDPLGLNKVETPEGLKLLVFGCITACAINVLLCSAVTNINWNEFLHYR